MGQFYHMDRLELENHIQCLVLILEIKIRKESFHVQETIFSVTLLNKVILILNGVLDVHF